MGDLKVIRGGGGEGDAPGSVDATLRLAQREITNENSDLVVIIALRKPYPPQLNARVIWSNHGGDKLRVIGLVQWVSTMLERIL